MTLPDQIRTARLQSGLTQRDLAERAYVSTQHVSFIEQGRRIGSPSVLKAIGKVLGVNLKQTYRIERRRLQRQRGWQ